MIKGDEQIKRDWANIDNSAIESAIQLLAMHGEKECEYIALSVAALCNVEAKVMLSRNNTSSILMARWLFWYAYRYYSNDTLSKIANMTKNLCGINFTANGIGQAINKIGALIESEPIWQRRWLVVKRIVKLREQPNEIKIDNTIVVQVPKDLRDKINIIIKEK